MSATTTPRRGAPAASGERPSVEHGRPPRRREYPDLSPPVKDADGAPKHRCRRYVGGMVSVPWDLIRDPKLGQGDKTVACALAAKCLPRSAEVYALTRDIGQACGMSRRAVQSGMRSLRDAGWIALDTAPGLQVRRKVVLLWLIPDDGEGLVPYFARGQMRPAPAPARARKSEEVPSPGFNSPATGNSQLATGNSPAPARAPDPGPAPPPFRTPLFPAMGGEP